LDADGKKPCFLKRKAVCFAAVFGMAIDYPPVFALSAFSNGAGFGSKRGFALSAAALIVGNLVRDLAPNTGRLRRREWEV